MVIKTIRKSHSVSVTVSKKKQISSSSDICQSYTHELLTSN